MDIEYRDIDERIWNEELAEFVPEKMYDVHTHILDPAHCLSKPDDPLWPRRNSVDEFGKIDMARIRRINATLFPGRTFEFLILASPFYKTDFEAQMEFMAQEVANDTPLAVGTMQVTPKMDADWVAEKVDQYDFKCLKPYRFHAQDSVECRITDMLPESLIEIANDKELIIMMHLGKSRALADPENIADLRRLAPKYPKVRWILAHCARCFAPWAIEHSVDQVVEYSNLWFGTSAVNSSDVFDLLFKKVPTDRILYSSDSHAGWMRAKYVWWGYAWQYLQEGVLDTAHCDPRATFVNYEQVRAMRYAARRHDFDKETIEAIFYDNALKMIHGDKAK